MPARTVQWNGRSQEIAMKQSQSKWASTHVLRCTKPLHHALIILHMCRHNMHEWKIFIHSNSKKLETICSIRFSKTPSRLQSVPSTMEYRLIYTNSAIFASHLVSTHSIELNAATCSLAAHKYWRPSTESQLRDRLSFSNNFEPWIAPELTQGKCSIASTIYACYAIAPSTNARSVVVCIAKPSS